MRPSATEVLDSIGNLPDLAAWLVGEQPAWMADALCLEHHNRDLWLISEQYARRIAVHTCRRCLVVDECLAYALDRPDLEGVWGATTTAERSRLRKDRTRVDQP